MGPSSPFYNFRRHVLRLFLRNIIRCPEDQQRKYWTTPGPRWSLGEPQNSRFKPLSTCHRSVQIVCTDSFPGLPISHPMAWTSPRDYTTDIYGLNNGMKISGLNEIVIERLYLINIGTSNWMNLKIFHKHKYLIEQINKNITNHLLTECEVLKGKYQTETL